MTSWSEFDRWNTALADVVYSTESAGLPVYLDLDDDILDGIAEVLDIARPDVLESLREVVRETLQYAGPVGQLFSPHLRRLTRWRIEARRSKREPEPPPVLPLLALTVLAAESMGIGEVARNAYFPHLYDELGASAPDDRRRIEQSYRRAAEPMWDSVDLWLTLLDGRRGLPTAFALSFRFVGLPMSQALVRAADRAKLVRMFDSFGLPPGYAMAPGDMAGLFDQWVRQQPCPVSASLANLWSKASARERIAEVVTNELLTWDGSGRSMPTETQAPSARGLRLLANMKRGLGKSQLQLTLALRSASEEPVTVSAVTADGSSADLSFLPGPGGLLRLDHLQDLDLKSILTGVLTVADSDGIEYSRHPRQLVPMSFDDAQAAFVEGERVQLAQEAILLVRDMGGRVDEIDALLTEIARPGFTRHDSRTSGVPEGWVLFTGVEVLGRPSGNLEKKYNELVPLASAQLTLAGGMKLPGRLIKWSSLAPPEIRAISQRASSIRVTLEARDAAEEGADLLRLEFGADDSVLTIDVSDLGLADGDYRLSLFEDSSPTPVQQLELRLRSGYTVDAWTWFGAKRLWHDFTSEGAWAALSASPATSEESDWIIDGPFARGTVAVNSAGAQGGSVWWTNRSPGQPSERPKLTVLAPDPRSCVVTGAHHLEYPTWYGPGHRGPQYIEGVCKYCGLVRRSPAWAPRSKATGSSSSEPVSIRVSTLQPAATSSVEHSWAAAVDGLMHLGGGRRVWLERLALQVDGSQLFVHEFIRAVAALGFIDTARDGSMRIDDWELVPRYIAELADGCFALIGYWPAASIEGIVRRTHDVGGRGLEREASASMTITVLEGLEPLQVEQIAAEFDATIIHQASSTMLMALPPISQVGDSLTRIPIPGGRAQEQFHLPSASWVSTPSTAGVGAFRVNSGHGWQYLFRGENDVQTGSAALGDAYIVKHLAAQQSGRPLLAYDSDRQLLIVPLGAELPGLYERAAVLSSGRLPDRLEGGAGSGARLLAYGQITPSDARRLWDLLSS